MTTTKMPDTINTTEKSGHNGDSRLTVYIFGAGASVSAGYPTAAAFAGELQQFRDRLSAEPERKIEKLKITISSTLKSLKETGAQTIDELVGSINETEAVEDAKTATEALFLDMEFRLTPQKLRDYCNFLLRACLSPGSGKVEDRLRADVRVLTFNYDRSLEIAFALLAENLALNGQSLNAPVNSYVKDLRQYYYNLNTGFQSGEGYDLKNDRFAFLKLHGSIGLKLPPHDPNIKHQQPFHVGTVLNDASLWKTNGGLQVPSLIAFPHEKAAIARESANLPTFHDYIAKIERDAIEAIQTAREVHICGYSVCQPKWTRFEEIIKCAPRDCLFVIHDKCELPCSRLRPIVSPCKAFHIKEDFSEAW